MTSYHFATFAFLPLLAAAKTVGQYPEPGNVVNMASLSGMTRTSQRGQFNYNSSKSVVLPRISFVLISRVIHQGRNDAFEFDAGDRIRTERIGYTRKLYLPRILPLGQSMFSRQCSTR